MQFPYGEWFVLISVLICLFSALSFGVVRASDFAHLTLSVDEDSAFQISMALYLFTLCCAYCVTVFRLDLEDLSGEFGEDARNLMDEWRDRK